jgi:cyanophycinase
MSIARLSWLGVVSSVAITCAFFACSDSTSTPADAGTVAPNCPSTDEGGTTGDAAVSDAGAVRGNKLMIVGGALADSSPIWQRTIEEGGGVANLRFLVVTAAITASAGNFAYYQDLLHRVYGVSLDHIQQARIGDIDDPNTKFEDESTYKENGDADAEVAKVRDWATVVWFAGGDQAHIMSTFTHPDGTDRKVTTAIREKLAAGKLLVAGTSAGAAIMSDPMIGEGDPYKSFVYPPVYAKYYPTVEPDGGFNPENAVLLNKGLGFLSSKYHVLVDTHWFQRARFPRTIRALDFAAGASGLDPKMKVGIGIGENSAMLVDLESGTAELVGDVDASMAGIVNINEAVTSGNTSPYTASKVRIGFIGARDRFALPADGNVNGTFLPEATKHRYLPCNKNLGLPPLTGDMFVPGALVDLLKNLLDGEPDGTLCHADGLGYRLAPGATAVGGAPFAVKGFFFRFTTDDKTKEFYSSDWGWEVENVLMQVGTGTGTIAPPF